MNSNTPYVLELAVNITLNEQSGGDTAGHHEVAAKNGVTEQQLTDALDTVRSLPDQSGPALSAWARDQYLSDGRAKGYVGANDEPSLWVLGQLAYAHYRN